MFQIKLGYDYQRQYETASDSRKSEAVCFVLPWQRERVCIAQAIEPGNEAKRDHDDLRAQQEMAFWAFIVSLFSGVGLVVSVGGVGLVYATFRKTGEAVDAANRTADDAKRIGEAEVRAYLHCRAAKFRRSRDNVAATLEIENTGQSPASHVMVRGTVSMYYVSGLPSQPRAHDWMQSEVSEANFQPVVSGGYVSDDIVFFEFDFPGSNEEEARNRDFLMSSANEVAFHLVLSWRDVFNEKQEFPFELSAVIDASPNSPNRKRARTGTLHIRRSDTFDRDQEETN